VKHACLILMLSLVACSGGQEGDDDVSFADAAPDLDAAPAVDATPPADADPASPDAAPLAHVVVNEIFAGGDPTNPLYATDWFEVKNLGDAPADLSGYHASDDPGLPAKGTFPAGTVIAPGGHLKVDLDAEPFLFSLKQGGTEPLLLVAPDGVTVLDTVGFAAGAAGTDTTVVSWGRFPDGSGAFETLETATPGATNVAR
jgi:hypothetical protein